MVRFCRFWFSGAVLNRTSATLTSIRGEVFDLSKLTQAHQCVFSVVPAKSNLNYGGEVADAIFPVQLSYDLTGS